MPKDGARLFRRLAAMFRLDPRDQVPGAGRAPVRAKVSNSSSAACPSSDPSSKSANRGARFGAGPTRTSPNPGCWSKIRTGGAPRIVVRKGMAGYGQFCAVARAHEVLGGRWTVLVVRELLVRGAPFQRNPQGDSAHLPHHALRAASRPWPTSASSSEKTAQMDRSTRSPTPALSSPKHIRALGVWGQRWLPRQAETEDFDLEPLLLDMKRRVRPATLPPDPMMVRFEVRGHRPRFLLLKAPEISLCDHNLAFPSGWWCAPGLERSRRGGEAISAFPTHAAPAWLSKVRVS